MTRASAGTRVNSSGLVETVELLGSELVDCGDFSCAVPLDYWTESGLASIGGGVASFVDDGTGVNSYIQQDILTAGKIYKVSFDVTRYVEGRLQVVMGSTAYSTDITSGVDTYTFYLEAISTGIFRLKRQGGYDFDFDIDNVSVKESTKNNLARVDYDGTASSLLVEPQRTNNIQYSEDFTQSYWRKDKVTVTANSIISPSGQLNASLIQETVYTSSLPSFDLSGVITLSAGTYTYTFYVKNNNGRYLGISFGSSGERVRTNFDFTTNTFKTLIFSGTTTGTASFTTLGDFYRITITATFPSSTSADTVLMPLATDTYPFYAFQDSDNRSFYLWGAQLEIGSYPTSYIPTDGSTVTRVQDQYSKTGISNLINSEEGVLFVEMAALENVNDDERTVSLSDGTNVNTIRLQFNTLNNNVRVFVGNGVTQVNSNITISDITVFNKFAFKYKQNDFALWINGSEVITDTSGNTFAAGTLNKLGFVRGDNTEYLFGKVKQLQVFKTALTDSELATLTT
tara:strand:- start:35 stop:1573 length:1539 start_codon:yes stop_codon:yes gene_type:complete